MASPVLAYVDQVFEVEVSEEQPEESTCSLLIKSQRNQLEEEMARAESLLGSHDENDDPYYSGDTLDRGIAFLKTHIDEIWKSCGTIAPLPSIGPGPRASVDLYWKTSSFELLVNIPASSDELGTYFGRDYSQQTTKGSFDPNRFILSIASWLMTT